MILIIFIAVFKKYMKSYVIDRVWKPKSNLTFQKTKKMTSDAAITNAAQ